MIYLQHQQQQLVATFDEQVLHVEAHFDAVTLVQLPHDLQVEMVTRTHDHLLNDHNSETVTHTVHHHQVTVVTAVPLTVVLSVVPMDAVESVMETALQAVTVVVTVVLVALQRQNHDHKVTVTVTVVTLMVLNVHQQLEDTLTVEPMAMVTAAAMDLMAVALTVAVLRTVDTVAAHPLAMDNRKHHEVTEATVVLPVDTLQVN